MTEDSNIRVQIDPRKDGRFTTTVKLVAQPLNELRAVAGGLRMLPIGRQIGEAVLVELQDVLEARSKLYQETVEVEAALQAEADGEAQGVSEAVEALKAGGDPADEES